MEGHFGVSYLKRFKQRCKMSKKRCPECSRKMRKHGKTAAGKQRWFCPLAGCLPRGQTPARSRKNITGRLCDGCLAGASAKTSPKSCALPATRCIFVLMFSCATFPPRRRRRSRCLACYRTVFDFAANTETSACCRSNMSAAMLFLLFSPSGNITGHGKISSPCFRSRTWSSPTDKPACALPLLSCGRRCRASDASPISAAKPARSCIRALTPKPAANRTRCAKRL